MKDFVLALMGTQHCGWCIYREATWWDRLMRFDQAMRTDSRPLYERIAMRFTVGNEKWFPIWKLGQRWHYRFHDTKGTASV